MSSDTVSITKTCLHFFLDHTPLSVEEHRTLNQLTRTRINRTLVFQWFFFNETIIHSVQYRKQGARQTRQYGLYRNNEDSFMDNLMLDVQLADISTRCSSHPQGKNEARCKNDSNL